VGIIYTYINFDYGSENIFEAETKTVKKQNELDAIILKTNDKQPIYP